MVAAACAGSDAGTQAADGGTGAPVATAQESVDDGSLGASETSEPADVVEPSEQGRCTAPAVGGSPIVALGVLGTSFAYVIAATNAGRLGSTRASVTTYIIPVVSLALGALVRNETVAVLAVLGCAVALFGAWLAGRRG